MSDFSRLSINSATTKKWTLAQVVDGCVNAGIPAIGPWRDRVEEAGLDKAARLIKDAGLRVSSLCRGGFLTAPDAEGQAAALADNRAAILEAVEMLQVCDARGHFLGRDGDSEVAAVNAKPGLPGRPEASHVGIHRLELGNVLCSGGIRSRRWHVPEHRNCASGGSGKCDRGKNASHGQGPPVVVRAAGMAALASSNCPRQQA